MIPLSGDIYTQLVLEQIPRLLSLQNRKKFSPTYGCFDRSFWQYKVIDFACARYQEAALTLALLYKVPFPGNTYHGSKKIREWAEAAMLFWTSIQHPDGSFDQNYPYEYGIPSTAFPTYAITESYMLLSTEIHGHAKAIIRDTLSKAGEWLLRREHLPTDPFNQEAGALVALYSVWRISGDTRFKEASLRKRDFILENQISEGWFPEYGGVDIGYHALTIDYLAKYYIKSGDKKMLDCLDKAVQFIYYFLHPDGTWGGEYGARSTEFIVPSGFEILADRNVLAREITERIICALRKRSLAYPRTLDDRYLCYNLYTYLEAYLHHKRRNQNTSSLNSNQMGTEWKKYFEIAKLYTFRNAYYQAIVGASKGGVIKIFDVSNEPQLFFSDCGFFGLLKDGTIVTNQWLDHDLEIDCDGDKITISGRFHKVGSHLPSYGKHMLLRSIIPLTKGSRRIRRFLFDYISRKIHLEARYAPVEFSREISFHEREIQIVDTLKMERDKLRELWIGEKFHPIYTMSADYFQNEELSLINPFPVKDFHRYVNEHRPVRVCRIINPLKRTVTLKEVGCGV